jgi:hypothetical protein
MDMRARATLSIHNPARRADESFEAYKARRRQSHAELRRITAYAINKGAQGSRQKLRDSMRASGTMGLRTRAYVALMAAWAAKQIPKWKGERDAAGAYTMTGGSIDRETGEYVRRKWLAGISELRGY